MDRTALVVVALAACSGKGRDRPAAATPAIDAAVARVDAAVVAIEGAPAPVDAAVAAPPCDGAARTIAPGITHERWRVDATPAIALEPCVDLFRADLAQLELRVVMASRDGAPRPAPRWLADRGLVAAINSGMFLDNRRSVGMLVDGDHRDQPRDNAKFGGYLAFGPREAGAPAVVIAGKGCPGFDLDALRARYRSIVQSYRLLDCDGAAIEWADAKAYSSAAIAIDRAGRVVFAHARAPFLMRELSRALARPALGLTGAIYVEGGPEATVAIATEPPIVLVGSYEAGFVESDDNHDAWPLPNLVALARR